MTRQKKTAKRKITGMVTNLTATQIRVTLATGKIWEIKRTSMTKVTVISGKPLRQGSRVTVEFNSRDGRVGGPSPGKRTETGTVIGVNDAQITLDNATPDPRTWRINRTASTVLLSGRLALNSTARVESDDGDWKQLA